VLIDKGCINLKHVRELDVNRYKDELNGIKCMKESKGFLNECDKLYVLSCNYVFIRMLIYNGGKMY